MVQKGHTEQTLIYDSNALNNAIAYSHLKNLVPAINQLLESRLIRDNNAPKLFKTLNQVSLIDEYSPIYPYYNRYRNLLLSIQLLVLDLNKNPAFKPTPEQQHALDNLLIAIYENDNNALLSSQNWINANIQSNIRINLDEKVIQDKLINQIIQQAAKSKSSESSPQNSTTPSKNGSALSNLYSVVGNNYQPMILGNTPTVRKYSYTSGQDLPVELRFSTQAEVVNGTTRVNPLFEAYLDAKLQHQRAQRNPEDTEDKITHIYFNALRRGGGPFERRREGFYTEELHKLEEKHSNIAVVTLPADGGLLELSHIKDNTTQLATSKVIDEIRETAIHNGPDFYISEHVRKATGLNEQKIDELIVNSLKYMKLDDPIKNAHITPAERNALMFHFVKYELTNHLIQSLNPQSVNFSCKDAIDRGGVHSLYYNFVKALNTGAVFTWSEFIQGIHAAPTMVKGRGMNHNSSLLWNALDKCVGRNKHTIKQVLQPEDPEGKNWLEEWLEINKPSNSHKVSTQVINNLAYDHSAQKHRRHYDLNENCGWFRTIGAFFAMLFFKLMTFSIVNNILLESLVNCRKITKNARTALNQHQYIPLTAQSAKATRTRISSTKSPLLTTPRVRFRDPTTTLAENPTPRVNPSAGG